MRLRSCAPALLLLASGTAGAQAFQDPAARAAAQAEAMKPLALLDGAWRGEAGSLQPAAGKPPTRVDLVQTERVGSLLGGTVKVVEGRGYAADGSTAFNALGIISYDPATRAYSMQANAMGSSGTFPMQVSATGYVWEVPAGPAKVRYTARVSGGEWHEIGEFVSADRPPMKVFEMRLKRLGPTDWPSAGAVPPR